MITYKFEFHTSINNNCVCLFFRFLVKVRTTTNYKKHGIHFQTFVIKIEDYIFFTTKYL